MQDSEVLPVNDPEVRVHSSVPADTHRLQATSASRTVHLVGMMSRKMGSLFLLFL